MSIFQYILCVISFWAVKLSPRYCFCFFAVFQIYIYTICEIGKKISTYISNRGCFYTFVWVKSQLLDSSVVAQKPTGPN